MYQPINPLWVLGEEEDSSKGAVGGTDTHTLYEYLYFIITINFSSARVCGVVCILCVHAGD